MLRYDHNNTSVVDDADDDSDDDVVVVVVVVVVGGVMAMVAAVVAVATAMTAMTLQAAVAARDLDSLQRTVKAAEKLGVEGVLIDVKAGVKACKMLEKEMGLLALLKAPGQCTAGQIKQALADGVAAGIDADVLAAARRALQDLANAHEAAAVLQRIDEAVRVGDEDELKAALSCLPDSDAPSVKAGHAALKRMKHRRAASRHLQQLLDEDSLDTITMEHAHDEAKEAGCSEELLSQVLEEIARRTTKMELQTELRDAMWAKDIERLKKATVVASSQRMDVTAERKVIEMLQATLSCAHDALLLSNCSSD